MCLAYEVMMTSQLKHDIMLSMFIGNISSIGKFSFGKMIIMIYRFTMCMPGKKRKSAKGNNLEHIFLHLNFIFNK